MLNQAIAGTPISRRAAQRALAYATARYSSGGGAWDRRTSEGQSARGSPRSECGDSVGPARHVRSRLGAFAERAGRVLLRHSASTPSRARERPTTTHTGTAELAEGTASAP